MVAITFDDVLAIYWTILDDDPATLFVSSKLKTESSIFADPPEACPFLTFLQLAQFAVGVIVGQADATAFVEL